MGLRKILGIDYIKNLTREELEEKYLNKIPIKIHGLSKGDTNFIFVLNRTKPINADRPHKIYPKKGFVTYRIEDKINKDIEIDTSFGKKTCLYIFKHRDSEFPDIELYFKKPFLVF